MTTPKPPRKAPPVPAGTAFVPHAYLSHKRMFGYPTRRNGNAWIWPLRGASPQNLRVAVMQHIIVSTVRPVMAREGVTTTRLARIAGLSKGQMEAGLRGERQFQNKELAAFASVSDDAFPDPAVIHNALVNVTTTLARPIRASGGTPGALKMLSADELPALATVAALAGVTGREQTEQDINAEQEMTAAAGPALATAAVRLAREQGLVGPEPEATSVVLQPDPDGPEVTGYVADGITLIGALRPTWAADTADYVDLDGHFVVDVLSRHSDGRPNQIQVLHLAPQRLVRGVPEADKEDVDWHFSTVPASVDWSGDSPRVTLANSPVGETG